MSTAAASSASSFNEEHLKIFYDRLFPYSPMFEWLSYGDQDLFWRREFSFTLANDVYIRYLSFQNAQEFRDKVRGASTPPLDDWGDASHFFCFGAPYEN